MTSIREIYEMAVHQYKIGQLKEAEALCRRIVESEPEYADVMHLYGAIASKKGEHDVALKRIERAISNDPRQPILYNTLGLVYAHAGLPDQAIKSFRMAVSLDLEYAEAYYNLAVTMKKQDRIDEAILNYQAVIQIEPENMDTLFIIGNLLAATGKIEEAIETYRCVIRLKPDYAITYNALGNALNLKGYFDDAIEQYLHAVALKPDFPEPYNNLGMIFKNQGKHNKAIEYYKKYLSLQPDMPDAYNNLGMIFHVQGKLERAVCSFEKALAIKPDFADAYYNFGNLLHDENEPDKAIDYYLKALKIQPEFAEAYNTLGIVYHDLNRVNEAISSYRNAIRMKPDCIEAYNNLGTVLFDIGKLDAAAVSYKKALEIRPDYAQAHNGMANIFIRTGEFKKAVLFYQKALIIDPGSRDAVGNLFEVLLMTCSWDQLENAAEQLDAVNRKAISRGERTVESPLTSITRHADPAPNYSVAKSWSKMVGRSMSAYKVAFPFENKSKNKKKITLGYVSSNFASHPVAHQMAGLYRLHNRERFNVFCYSCGLDDGSDYRKRIMEDCDKFVDLQGISHPDAAMRIYEDDVDILVDLMGHTKGNRMEILALRPAPVQVGYLGFLGTTGADFIDYFITDRVVTPQDHAAYYSEKFVYMPHCYQINDNSQKVSGKKWQKTDFNLPENCFIFCSFNNPRKIESEMFDCWMKILRQIPDSVLWLQGGATNHGGKFKAGGRETACECGTADFLICGASG